MYCEFLSRNFTNWHTEITVIRLGHNTTWITFERAAWDKAGALCGIEKGGLVAQILPVSRHWIWTRWIKDGSKDERVVERIMIISFCGLSWKNFMESMRFLIKKLPGQANKWDYQTFHSATIQNPFFHTLIQILYTDMILGQIISNLALQ